MYDTGLMEEIKDVVLSRKAEAVDRAEGFSDLSDRLIEKAARLPGRALWREMKAGAKKPFDPHSGPRSVRRARKAVHPNFIDILSQMPISKRLCCPISALRKNFIFGVWNINHMPPVKPELRLAARLDLDQNFSFPDGHEATIVSAALLC